MYRFLSFYRQHQGVLFSVYQNIKKTYDHLIHVLSFAEYQSQKQKVIFRLKELLTIFSLAHSFPISPFSTPENIRKPYGSLFSRDRERAHWGRVDWQRQVHQEFMKVKVRLSPSKNVGFICFNESPSKMMKMLFI